MIRVRKLLSRWSTQKSKNKPPKKSHHKCGPCNALKNLGAVTTQDILTRIGVIRILTEIKMLELKSLYNVKPKSEATSFFS